MVGGGIKEEKRQGGKDIYEIKFSHKDLHKEFIFILLDLYAMW